MSIISKEIEKLIKENLKEILSLRNTKALKEDNSYVSKGDLLMEKLIKDFIKNNIPEFYLISEETPEDNIEAFNQKKIIILDPIDGTENFVSGLKEWGVSFCVYENGKCTDALLALPELDIYLKKGDDFKVFESRIAGLSSSLMKEDLLNLKDGFEYRIIGCCVYNMYNVITGSYHSFENPKGAKVWDIIAGLNIALDNNLKIIVNKKTYNGELLRPDQKHIFRVEQN